MRAALPFLVPECMNRCGHLIHWRSYCVDILPPAARYGPFGTSLYSVSPNSICYRALSPHRVYHVRSTYRKRSLYRRARRAQYRWRKPMSRRGCAHPVGRNPKTFHQNLVIVQKILSIVDTFQKLWYKSSDSCVFCTAKPPFLSRRLLIFQYVGRLLYSNSESAGE